MLRCYCKSCSILVIALSCIPFFNLFAQTTFSFNRNFTAQETHCFKLAAEPDDIDIDSVIGRFHESPINDSDKTIFRIVNYAQPGNLKYVTIRSIEKNDTSCIVTVKFLKNYRRQVVMVHSKTYDLEKWKEFRLMVSRYFQPAPGESVVKASYQEHSFQRYEFIENKNYQVLTGENAGSNISWLNDYLEYLVSPIFAEECP